VAEPGPVYSGTRIAAAVGFGGGFGLDFDVVETSGTLRRGAEAMEVHLPPEVEARLVHSAAQQGRAPDDLAQEIIARYFEEEIRFVEEVKRGEDALQRGEYLTHEQLGERLRRVLQS